MLEVGCGVGAVLAVLGQEFPGLRLVGVDIEPKQLDFARGHLERSGIEATLVQADALALPFEDESFDHVWMMWFLEHVADPMAVLREARRVLVPGGAITAIEVDYSTCRAEPSTPPIEALIRTMVAGMAASGRSDAGTRLPGWLREAGFGDVAEGERPYWWQNDDLAVQASYAADVIESALDVLAQLPGADEGELRAGLRDLRALVNQPGAGLGWVVHKSTAVRYRSLPGAGLEAGDHRFDVATGVAAPRACNFEEVWSKVVLEALLRPLGALQREGAGRRTPGTRRVVGRGRRRLARRRSAHVVSRPRARQSTPSPNAGAHATSYAQPAASSYPRATSRAARSPAVAPPSSS